MTNKSSVQVRRWAALVAAVASAASCGGSDIKPAATGKAAICEGQPREPLNCESEVKYDGTDVKGGLSILGFGNASGGVEQKALRQIDDQTALYVAEARRLCEEYNKCVLDRDTYATRTENMRRRVAKVPELLDGVKSASTDDARRVALGKAYREIIPSDARIELRLDFSALAQRPGEQAMVPVAPGASIPTGSHLAFVVRVSRPSYVYVFEKNARGSLDVLFPDARIGLRNPISAGAALRIPEGSASFRLDDKDLGTEKVYMVASLGPVAQLASTVQRAAQGEPLVAEGALGRVASIDPKCPSRGLSLDENGPPPGACVRSRGLSLDADTGSSSSLSTTTEAADDTIATVFRFEHTH